MVSSFPPSFLPARTVLFALVSLLLLSASAQPFDESRVYVLEEVLDGTGEAIDYPTPDDGSGRKKYRITLTQAGNEGVGDDGAVTYDATAQIGNVVGASFDVKWSGVDYTGTVTTAYPAWSTKMYPGKEVLEFERAVADVLSNLESVEVQEGTNTLVLDAGDEGSLVLVEEPALQGQGGSDAGGNKKKGGGAKMQGSNNKDDNKRRARRTKRKERRQERRREKRQGRRNAAGKMK